MEIKIINIRESRIANSMCKAFIDTQIDNLIIKGMRIIDGRNGMFISYPREKGKDERFYDLVIPADMNTKQEIEKYLLDEYFKFKEDKLPPEAD